MKHKTFIRLRIAHEIPAEIVNRLSEEAQTLAGCCAALQALDSDLNGDRMSLERMSAFIWMIERQLSRVHRTIEEALLVQGGDHD
jgi:hypothetical protein